MTHYIYLHPQEKQHLYQLHFPSHQCTYVWKCLLTCDKTSIGSLYFLGISFMELARQHDLCSITFPYFLQALIGRMCIQLHSMICFSPIYYNDFQIWALSDDLQLQGYRSSRTRTNLGRKQISAARSLLMSGVDRSGKRRGSSGRVAIAVRHAVLGLG
uniref:Uncharacterized protein n=1 Tax=Aegilops tauschii subsp. strangulata TaxID=200361 RepID=A0A453SAG7_AEGTS